MDPNPHATDTMMPRIHVCPLDQVEEISRMVSADSLVTLLNVGTDVVRPAHIPAHRHLSVRLSDIVAPLEGHVLPAPRHVEALLDFVRDWDRTSPLLIACYAAVSRSTAAAFITACTLAPDRSEAEHAARLRAASPTATPNARLVALADRILERDGRMIEAVEAIGRGADCFAGAPFPFELR